MISVTRSGRSCEESENDKFSKPFGYVTMPLTLSFLKAALLLVSTRNRDLWEGPDFLSTRRVIVSYCQLFVVKTKVKNERSD